jgi:hypothetical protein
MTTEADLSRHTKSAICSFRTPTEGGLARLHNARPSRRSRAGHRCGWRKGSGWHAINVLGPIRVTHAFLPLLHAADHPRIVNVSSAVGSFHRLLEPGTAENALTLPAIWVGSRWCVPIDRRDHPRSGQQS